MTGTSGIRVGALDYYEAEIQRQLLDELPDMALEFTAGPTEQDRIAVARDADVLLVGWSPVSTEVIRASPRLRLVQKMGVGVDRIDLATAQELNVRVLRAAGINADAVAEMTILLMLAVLRELPWAVNELRSGRFQKESLRKRTIQLTGQRVGLVGLGHIGTAVATRLQGFGVEVAYFDTRADLPTDLPSTAPMALDDLLAWSDIVSLHIPLVSGRATC